MDFIEQWFGISPDGGDGSLELWWIVGIAIVVAAVAFRHRIIGWLSSPRSGRSQLPDPLRHSSQAWMAHPGRPPGFPLCPFFSFPFLIRTCSQDAIR